MPEWLLSDAEILKAWKGALDKPTYLDHKPTYDDLLLIRIKAVLAAAKQAEARAERRV